MLNSVPFVLGQSTNPSFSVIASVQDALAKTEQYSANAPDRKVRMPPVQRPILDQVHEKEFHVHIPLQAAPESEQLNRVVQSLEKEFMQLSTKYNTLMENLKKEDEEQAAAILDALETKGQQLYWIKQAHHQQPLSPPAPTSMKSPIQRSVVHSPEAFRRKAVALNLLREYRDLDRP